MVTPRQWRGVTIRELVAHVNPFRNIPINHLLTEESRMSAPRYAPSLRAAIRLQARAAQQWKDTGTVIASVFVTYKNLLANIEEVRGVVLLELTEAQRAVIDLGPSGLDDATRDLRDTTRKFVSKCLGKVKKYAFADDYRAEQARLDAARHWAHRAEDAGVAGHKRIRVIEPAAGVGEEGPGSADAALDHPPPLVALANVPPPEAPHASNASFPPSMGSRLVSDSADDRDVPAAETDVTASEPEQLPVRSAEKYYASTPRLAPHAL